MPQKKKRARDSLFATVEQWIVLMHSENRIPTHFIKPVEDGINELRVTVPNKELRILFFYDGEQLVVLLNCFVKKRQKTPRLIIETAAKLKKQYYEEKQ